VNVLLTGPSGRLGPHLVAPFRERYQLRTFNLAPSPEPNSYIGDLSKIEPLREAMRGCEVVVHLAATSDEAPFVEKLVPNNVIGLYNVLEAARLEKVRRVVFASSIHAMSFNLKGQETPVETDELPRPGTLYGATKVLGETLGRWFHDTHQLEFVALRIGAFQPYDSPWLAENKASDIWLSPRDAATLFQKAIEAPGIGYAIVNGTSKTTRERMSLQSAQDLLGYEPADDARDFYHLSS
jgi:nucleoside-diphosphate-sugar epimerase